MHTPCKVATSWHYYWPASVGRIALRMSFSGPSPAIDHAFATHMLTPFLYFFDSGRVVNHGPTSGECYLEYEKVTRAAFICAFSLVSPSNAPRLTCSTPSPPSSGSATLPCLLTCYQYRLLCWMGSSAF